MPASRLGSVDEFEDGQIYAFDIEGRNVAVVRLRGRFYAFSNRCTHWQVPLSDGYVTSAGQVVCLYHDSAFDLRSGAAVDGPAPKDIAVYQVLVEGSDVFLTVP